MLLNFKVASDSPALEVVKQNHMEKKDLKGIDQFKMSAVRQELDRRSGFLSNAALIKLPGNNLKLVMDAVGGNKLFVAPFDVFALVANSGKAYRETNIEDLKEAINVYPLTHSTWVRA